MVLVAQMRHFVGKVAKVLFPKTMEYRRIVSEHNWEINHKIQLTKKSRQEQLDSDVELYKNKIGHELNIYSPNSFSEKIQWRKFFDADPIYSYLSDKYFVRSWVANKIGAEYLIPLLGVWDNEKKINFKELPDDFVLKTNNGYATNYFVHKNEFNKKIILETFRYWLRLPFWINTYELHYRIISPKIIAEKYMKDINSNGIEDYKFHCFKGKPQFCEVHSGRFISGQHKCAEYDMEWKRLDWVLDSKKPELFMDKPKNFDELYNIACKLCIGFEYVRVDLYDINGHIYFGEMTFTDSSGLCRFFPDGTDEMIGQMWDINKPQVDYKLVGLTPEEVFKAYSIESPKDLYYVGKTLLVN